MSITLEQAKELRYGIVLYHATNRNADGTPQRWRVNGTPRTWATRPGEVRVPIKHGLRTYDYLSQDDLDTVCLSEEEAMAPPAEVPHG